MYVPDITLSSEESTTQLPISISVPLYWVVTVNVAVCPLGIDVGTSAVVMINISSVLVT